MSSKSQALFGFIHRIFQLYLIREKRFHWNDFVRPSSKLGIIWAQILENRPPLSKESQKMCKPTQKRVRTTIKKLDGKFEQVRKELKRWGKSLCESILKEMAPFREKVQGQDTWLEHIDGVLSSGNYFLIRRLFFELFHHSVGYDIVEDQSQSGKQEHPADGDFLS